MIQTVDTFNVDAFGTTTCVWMAFKAFQLKEFSFSLDKIDPTAGTLAKSQKEKFHKIRQWDNSPFHEYRCNEGENHFIIVKTYSKFLVRAGAAKRQTQMLP